MVRKIVALVFLCALFVGFIPGRAQAAGLPHLVISEVKLGGAITGQPTEFVELFNDTNVPITTTGWLLEYAKTGALITAEGCILPSWQTVPATTLIKQTVLAESVIQPRGRAVVLLSLNDNVGGSIRLIQPSKDSTPQVVHDLVGWSSVTSPSSCFEGAVSAPLPANGKSIKRKFDLDGHPVDTNQNSNDFTIDTVSPSPEMDAPPPSAPDPVVLPQCVGIELSEILANPAGSDTTHEFIELYNSSVEPQTLVGCGLRSSAGSKVYNLPDMVLAPGERRAFYDDTTGLNLTNSGGQVWLIAPDREEIVNYLAVDDDQAWIFSDGRWQITTLPTPNQANLLQFETEDIGDYGVSAEPCPAGKYRNPDTNRCKNIESSESTLMPCDPGEERNLATNRCRSLASAIAALVPCQDGYERSPETNRCRKEVTLGESNLKPCDEGEARNPDTNRCRKTAGQTSSATSEPKSKPSSSPLHRSAIMAVVALVIGYGIYEYKDDLANIIERVRSRKRR